MPRGNSFAALMQTRKGSKGVINMQAQHHLLNVPCRAHFS